MEPKRRSYSDAKNQSKKPKLSNTSACSAEPIVQSNVEAPSLPLLCLPNEVLLRIFQYLSPEDLMSLSRVGELRLTELSYVTNNGNFSSCRRISSEQVAPYFYRTRTKNIRKLQFQYNVCLKPSELVKMICRCKNLVSLTIVECGVTHLQVCQILKQCTKLEELTWNVKDFSTTFACKSDSLKKIYLLCHAYPLRGLFDRDPKAFERLYRSFPNMEKMFIIFATDFLLGSPVMGMWFKPYRVSSDFPVKEVFVINSSYCFYDVRRMVNPRFDNDDGEDLIDIEEKCRSHKLWSSPPYLAIQSTKADIAAASSGPSNAFSAMLIYLTPDVSDVAESLAKCIVKVSGPKLKYLCLQFENRKIENLESTHVCYVLEMTSLTCRNITTLDLTTVHFDMFSPFKAICQLKQLRTLCMPSCAFPKSSEDQHVSFQEVVSSCRAVKIFAFTFCTSSTRKGMDSITKEDLEPIKGWEDLKQLSVFNIVFNDCYFLRTAARFCKKLESLSLVTATHDHQCIFMDDVIYFLQSAKNLSFFRINSKTFNPMYERFWNTIGESTKLEGICITSDKEIWIKKKVIIEAIQKLRNLHLFHFFAPKVSDSMANDVKKSMAENGVKNVKLGYGTKVVYNELSSFYHTEPGKSACNYLHLNDICF